MVSPNKSVDFLTKKKVLRTDWTEICSSCYLVCPAHRLARERIREKYLQQDEVEMVEAWDFLDQELLPVDLLVIVSVEISLESHIVPPHAPPHLLHLLVSLVLRRLALQRLGALLLVQVQWCRDGCECALIWQQGAVRQVPAPCGA